MEPNLPITPTPNLYVLSGKHLHVTYSPHGKRHFSYQDQQQALSFTGEEIRSVEIGIGTLVSVTIRMIGDSGGTIFSVLLPTVDVPAEQAVPIRTDGITTLLRFFPVGGQRDFYTVTRLNGSASNLGPVEL